MTVLTADEVLKFLTEKKNAYVTTFGVAGAKLVLDDLMPFCRARESCVVPGDRDRTYVLEGRREVWLRIRDFLDRTPEELLTMLTKPLEGDKANG